MRESIHKYFQMGTLQWMSFPGCAPLDSLQRIVKDDFFDAIELTHYPDDRARACARQLLQQAHMKICYGAQPCLLESGLNPNALQEQERCKAERALFDAVDEAEELGASTLVFMAGKWREEAWERAFEQLLRTTCNLCRYAGEKGMMVELEIFDFDVDKAVLIGPAPLAEKFAGEVRKQYGNFGLLVDLSHIPLTHEKPAGVIHTLRPYITHLHFGNAVATPGCAGYGDKHPRFGYPNGANDVAQLEEFFRALRQEGLFRAADPLVLSMEVTPQAKENPETILANTKRVVRRAWALLND